MRRGFAAEPKWLPMLVHCFPPQMRVHWADRRNQLITFEPHTNRFVKRADIEQQTCDGAQANICHVVADTLTTCTPSAYYMCDVFPNISAIKGTAKRASVRTHTLDTHQAIDGPAGKTNTD